MSAQRVILTIAASSPTLLMHLVGMILAVAFWRRYPRASLLCLLGLGLLLLTTIEQLAMQFLAYRFVAYFDGKRYMLWIPFVIENVAHAAGIALLLGAIFSGRKAMHMTRQEPVPVDQAPLAKTPSFNITRPRSGDSLLTDR